MTQSTSAGRMYTIDASAVRLSIAEDIAQIRPLDELEANDRERAAAWVASGAEIWRVQKPATPPLHLIAYFVVVDGDFVLLGDHRKSGRWLPGGGHVEPGESPHETVRRECLEEFGFGATFLSDRPFFVSFVDTVGSTAGHTDACLWYALQGDRSGRIDLDSGEYIDARWFSLHELGEVDTDPAMLRALRKFTRLHGMPNVLPTSAQSMSASA